MTEAGWTREKPTVAGWYWFRRGKQQAHTIVQVWGNTCGWRVLEMGRQYAVVIGEYEGGEFLGPITPDSYQQGRVAGLEAASRVADSFPWSRGGRLENPLHIGRREGEKAASEHIAAEIRKLAQQAQGGRGGGCAWLTIVTIM